MKNFIITANWKLNGNKSMVLHFFSKLKKDFIKNSIFNKIIVAPPIIYLNNINKIIKHDNFFLCAQNVDIHEQGAFTGEISANMLKDIGVQYVIIGHSERRIYHKENNNNISYKFKLLKKTGLIPILCVGENLEEKNNHLTEVVCKKQIDSILNIVGENAFKNSIIAYEPIWAIGSGVTAKPNYVQKVHKFIKNYISENSNIQYKEIIIQYGGSVNEMNILPFLMEDDIDGVLLGGSSLIYEKFIQIIELSKNIR